LKQWITHAAGSAHAFKLPGEEFFPAQIRKERRMGWLTFLGFGKVMNERTLHYRTEDRALEIWVRAGTDRIVQAKASDSSMTRFTWLPTTTSNLRKTQLVVPRGFRHRG